MKTTRTFRNLMRSARKIRALVRAQQPGHSVARLIRPTSDLESLAADFDQRRCRDQRTEDFLDISQFDWIREIETLAADISRESRILVRALREAPVYRNSRLTQPAPADASWGVVPLFSHGRPIEWLHDRFPATYSAVSMIPGCVSAMFSILQPGQQLEPHIGQHSATLQYQLAALIPDPGKCAQRVGHETRHWRQGQSMVINDYREQTAWNRSNKPLVILLMDFKRAVAPALRPQRELVIKQFSGSHLNRGITQTFRTWLEQHDDEFARALEHARDSIDAADNAATTRGAKSPLANPDVLR